MHRRTRFAKTTTKIATDDNLRMRSDLLAEAVYGLPEMNREAIRTARLGRELDMGDLVKRAPDRERLLATCAWPLAIVNEAGSVVGVLMLTVT